MGSGWKKKYVTVDAQEIIFYKDDKMKQKDKDSTMLLKHIGLVQKESSVVKNEPKAFDVIYVTPETAEQIVFTLRPYDGKKMTSKEAELLTDKLKARCEKAIEDQVKRKQQMNQQMNLWQKLTKEELNEQYKEVLRKQAIPEQAWTIAMSHTAPEQKWKLILELQKAVGSSVGAGDQAREWVKTLRSPDLTLKKLEEFKNATRSDATLDWLNAFFKDNGHEEVFRHLERLSKYVSVCVGLWPVSIYDVA